MLTQSITCQPWQAAHVYVRAAPAELSRWNWVKESSGMESERMTCSLNTLRDHIFALWVTIRFPHPLSLPPFLHPAIPGSSLHYCCRLCLGGRDQSQAKVINPHHGRHQQFGEGPFVVMCEPFWWSPINWTIGLNHLTHSSDSRCSRWKALDWILLMLFILRSLRDRERERNQSWVSHIKVSTGTKSFWMQRYREIRQHIFHNVSIIHNREWCAEGRERDRWLEDQREEKRDVERKFSPMNHFWAAAISCLSCRPSLFQMSHSTFTVIWPLTLPFKWTSVPSSVLPSPFQVSLETLLPPLFVAGTCAGSIPLPPRHALWCERACWGRVLTQLCCGQGGERWCRMLGWMHDADTQSCRQISWQRIFKCSLLLNS